MKDNSFFRKFRSTYLTTVISLSLLLFILGIQVYLWLAAQKISNNIKDNIAIELILKDEIAESEIVRFKSLLDGSEMVKETIYISKDNAAKNFEKELGENFVDLTGYNPLFASLEVHLKPEFNNKKTIDDWIASNRKYPIVQDVIYKNDVADLVSSSLIKINTFLSVITLMLMISAVLMIYNNNRIAIFNERFTIKTMYLVGASQGYILRPFIFRAVRHSIYALLVSILFLFVLIQYLSNIIPEITSVADVSLYTKLFIIIVAGGIFFTLISTVLAIRTVLTRNTDKIY
jgi:cell division transport system permease protein